MLHDATALDTIQTIIFDLDGTLYEDMRVYDRYAAELARFLPVDRQQQYAADWALTKQRQGVARVGMGYDETRDRLFRFAGNRILHFIDWNGHPEPVPRPDPSTTHREIGAGPPPDAPTIEVPIFGTDRFNIGDWWGLPDVLASHYGVARDERGQAFLATRAYMGSDAFHIQPEPGLRDALLTLNTGGFHLVVMTNSPAETTAEVLDHLGIHTLFAHVAPSSKKPLGMRRFLEQVSPAERVLSIGDNYINDIEPVLQAGGHAVYIDRHATELGTDRARCYHVLSIQAALEWLAASIGSHHRAK